MSTGKRSREVFTLTDGSYMEAIPLLGSPCWIVNKFVLCADSPTGYYIEGESGYISARSAYAAVNDYLAGIRAR